MTQFELPVSQTLSKYASRRQLPKASRRLIKQQWPPEGRRVAEMGASPAEQVKASEERGELPLPGGPAAPWGEPLWWAERAG